MTAVKFSIKSPKTSVFINQFRRFFRSSATFLTLFKTTPISLPYLNFHSACRNKCRVLIHKRRCWQRCNTVRIHAVRPSLFPSPPCQSPIPLPPSATPFRTQRNTTEHNEIDSLCESFNYNTSLYTDV